MTLFPATTTVAVRLAPPFAVTDTTAVPEPVLLPETVAHADGDDEFHELADDVVTVTEAVAAAFEKLKDPGDTV